MSALDENRLYQQQSFHPAAFIVSVLLQKQHHLGSDNDEDHFLSILDTLKYEHQETSELESFSDLLSVWDGVGSEVVLRSVLV
jgi:hypothetical protein